MKLLENLKLTTALKVCAFIMGVLLLIGMGIGVSRINQAKQERNDIGGINQSLVSKGVTDEFKGMAADFVKKYSQTKNIIVTDKDNKIVYSANKQVIGDRAEFVLETRGRNEEVVNLKDSNVYFITDPRAAMPMKFRTSWANDNFFSEGPEMRGDKFEMGSRRIKFNNDKVLIMRGPERGKGPMMRDALFLNSYSIADKGLNANFISGGFRENNMMNVLMITSVLLRAFGLLFWMLLAAWVYKDSKERGLNPIFWGLLTLIAGPFGLAAYLIYRHYGEFCKACKHRIEKDDNFCKKCGAAVKSNCAGCGHVISQSANYCPHCGKSLNEEK